MYRDGKSTQILQKLHKLMEQQSLYTIKLNQTSIEIQKLLAEMSSCRSVDQTPPAFPSEQIPTATPPLPPAQDNEDEYHVILNLRDQSLRYRQDPHGHGPLVQADWGGIGSYRIQLLTYMLDHPGDPFYVGNLFKVYGPLAEVRSDSTFTKAMGQFRKALGQHDTSGPYLQKQHDYEDITGKKRGYIYRINPAWRYLIRRPDQSDFRANSLVAQSYGRGCP